MAASWYFAHRLQVVLVTLMVKVTMITGSSAVLPGYLAANVTATHPVLTTLCNLSVAVVVEQLHVTCTD